VIVDSSALVAIVLAEPGHEVLVQHLARAPETFRGVLRTGQSQRRPSRVTAKDAIRPH